MDVNLEESEVKVKEEAADTNIQSQGQIDLIPDWKLNRNAECRDTGILPSMESQVKWSTFGGTQIGQDGTNVRENAEEISEESLQSQTPSVDDDIDIKYEGSGIENNSTSIADSNCDLNPDPHSMLPTMNPVPGTQCPINSEQIELSEFFLRLLQCEQDCETCQKYIRKLREHVRVAHAEAQPSPDTVINDTIEIDQPSAIGIKCEVGEDTDRKGSSEESESDPDYNNEDSENEGDPDYITPAVLTRKVSLPNNNFSRHIPKDRTGAKRYESRGKGFPGEEILTAHKRSHTGRKGSRTPFNCTDCGKCFTEKTILIVHMTSHTREKPFKCTECEKSFSQKCNLGKHMRTHTSEKYDCKDCGRRFKKEPELTIHMRAHTGEKPFKCTECEKSFSQKCNLGKHMRSHSGEMSYKCKDCGRRFKNESELAIHMRVHTGEKPFKCSECKKSYSQRGNLNYHMRIHTSEKYKCQDCGRCFKKESELTIHMRVHTGEKPFKCSECKKSYSQKGNLNYHMRIHTGGKPYVCEQK